MKVKLNPKQREIAAQAANLLEKGHCRNAYAEDAHGEPCRYDAPCAVAWCYYGALLCASAPPASQLDSIDRILTLAEAMRQELSCVSIVTYSDTQPTAQADGVRVLRRLAAGSERHNE